MEIAQIFTGPFKGEFCNSKIKIQHTIIVNLILSVIFSLGFVISIKSLTSGVSTGLSTFGFGSVYNEIVIKVFFMIFINFIAITYAFSGIIFIVNKFIFKSNITFNECVSLSTYANIIPTLIFFIAQILSILSFTLGAVGVSMSFIMLLILIYEGISVSATTGKYKLICSIAVTNLVNIIIFSVINYTIIKSMIESMVGSLF